MALLIILISGILSNLQSPTYPVLYIEQSEGINAYEPLIRAVTYVESLHGKYVYNAEEKAVGWFQIRQIRVDHYNSLLGTDYKLEDFYDYELSRNMFLHYTKGRSYESVARSWNGSGYLTTIYWNKVSKQL